MYICYEKVIYEFIYFFYAHVDWKYACAGIFTEFYKNHLRNNCILYAARKQLDNN